jgi:hypothetical protein
MRQGLEPALKACSSCEPHLLLECADVDKVRPKFGDGLQPLSWCVGQIDLLLLAVSCRRYHYWLMIAPHAVHLHQSQIRLRFSKCSQKLMFRSRIKCQIAIGFTFLCRPVIKRGIQHHDRALHRRADMGGANPCGAAMKAPIRCLSVLVLLLRSVDLLTTDVELNAPLNAYNPSLAREGSHFVLAFRSTNVTRTGTAQLWQNAAFLCASSIPEAPAQCFRWSPFGSGRKECTWTDGTVGTDTAGIEDPKLFFWPGKGEHEALATLLAAADAPLQLQVSTKA